MESGYKCNFVEPVPSSLICPVCQLPFRDPHILNCCSAKCCAPCIGRVKATGQPCPTCKQPFNSIMEENDKGKVLHLKVRCSNEGGCKWTGELRHLATHEAAECEWVHRRHVLVECRHGCGKRCFPRAERVEHEQECLVSVREQLKEVLSSHKDLETVLDDYIKKGMSL